MNPLDLRESGGLLLLGVRVKPGSRPALSLTDAGLVVAVAAPRVEGRATEEARRALARALGVPASSVALKAGARSPRKVFALSGLDVDAARSRLRAAVR